MDDPKAEGGVETEIETQAQLDVDNNDEQAVVDKTAKLVEQRLRLERMRFAQERHRLRRDKELMQLQNRLAENKKPTFDHLEHTDKSRKHIAFVFVYGYIIIVGLILIGVPLYNWLALGKPPEIELEKTLAQVGALIGSPLGFVVGYYFKEDSRN